jgi:hypothetical protein
MSQLLFYYYITLTKPTSIEENFYTTRLIICGIHHMGSNPWFWQY